MTRIAQTLLASLVAALALCAAATAGGPVLAAGGGCALACIEQALVTPTASSASVAIETSVPASVTVETAPVDAGLGLATGPAPRDLVVPPFVTTRTVLIPGLRPETTYRIVVHARDAQGHVQTRSGTFTTRKVKVAVDLPDVGLSAGLGCKADCLERGTLTSDADVPGRARLALRATVPVTFENFGKKVTITFSLKQENKTWKIEDIRFTRGDSLMKWLKDTYPAGAAKVTPADGTFDGRYQVGETTCTVEPIKMSYEVRWAKGKGAENFFYKNETTFESATDGGNQFVFDDGNYNTGTFYRSDGKTFAIKRLR